MDVESTQIELARAREWNWGAIIDRHVHERPERVALRYRGASTTWRQLREQTDRLADELAAAGVVEGDRVAIVLLNRPEYFVAVAAITELKAIAVPVNFRLAPAELAFILSDADAAAVVTEAALRPAVEAALAHEVEEFSPGRARRLHDVDEGLGTRRPASHRPRTVFPEDDPAFIFYTSGTTGRPKGATLTWRNLRSQSDIVIRAWRLTGEHEVVAAATTLFHIAGLGLTMPAFQIGATVVIHPLQAFDATELVDLVERERVGSLFLVPAMWQAMVRVPGVAGRMPTLRTTAWGAAPASGPLLEAMAEAFPRAQNVALFGQTEMSPITCMLFGEDALRKLGSVGRAADGVQVRVIDEDGSDVAPGEVGEIVYRGVGAMLGYGNRPEATAEAFAGGWFHSGDLVRIDEDGFVFVVDRTKDMIITGGENVYSVEVENVLASHPRIREVAVVACADERWGEVVVACVVAVDDADVSLDELTTHVTGRLAAYKRPRAVVRVDELPRNATGKVLKNVLRELAAGAIARS